MPSNASDPASATTAHAASAAREPARVRIEAWSFRAAYAAVFLVLVFGWGLGIPIRRVFADKDASALNLFALVVGAISALSFVALNLPRVLEFFLSVRVGVAILTFFLLGSIASVLVHPRDPNKYGNVTLEQRERANRGDAAFAHGYFVFNLMHPYGIGLQHVDVPEVAKASLERIGQRYGERAANQEASGMRTAFNGKLRTGEVEDFIAHHAGALDAFYRAACFLQLNGTPTGKGAWSSDWFTTLMGLLFVAVLMNTFRRGFARAIALGPPGMRFVSKLPEALAWDLRSLVSKPRIGFLTTHLGVMTALVGGVISRATEERGMVQLSIDPPPTKYPQRSQFYETYDGQVRPLLASGETFAVELTNFRADYRDTLDVEFIGDPEPKGNMVPRYRWFETWTGRQISLDFDADGKPREIVRVLDHWDRADVRFRLVDRASDEAPRNPLEASGPILEVTWRQLDGRAFTRRLFAGHPDFSVLDDVPGARIRLEAAADGAEQAARLAAPLESAPIGTLEVWVGADAKAPASSCVLEKDSSLSFDTPIGRISAQVLQALPDARHMATLSGDLVPQFASVPPERVAPLHPGVELLLKSSNGKTVNYWVYEDPRDGGKDADNTIPIGQVPVRFVVRWDHWLSPALDRYRIVLAPGLPAAVAKVGGARLADLAVGGSVDLGAAGKLTLDQRADRPRLLPVIEPLPGDASSEEAFFDVAHPGAARVEVEGPDGKHEFLLAAVPLANTAETGKLRLRLFEDSSDLPREWKSKLTFLKQAGNAWKPDTTGTIRVNDYFTYRGYRFFQTDANPRFPGYSGVGIVYDPGIETVLVGMWAVILGVAYVFFLKPFLVRRAAA